MKAILLYNLFPRTIWKDVTDSILKDVPHDSIVIHVTMPIIAWIKYPFIKKYLKKINKVDKIIFSTNNKKLGESKGFERMRTMVDFSPFDIITYAHSKGTSRRRKNTPQIAAWTELMRYFVIERLDICKEKFKEGYMLYGVNLSQNVSKAPKYSGLDTSFIFEGNFVNLNNKLLGEKFLSSNCYKSYYGVERFWGNICSADFAFNVHSSNTDHYNAVYPKEFYIS